MDSNIYAEKGEVITCVEGHPVFVMTANVEWGQAMDLTRQMKIYPGQPVPRIGQDLETVKCWCGARYVNRFIPGKFHFKEGWR